MTKKHEKFSDVKKSCQTTQSVCKENLFFYLRGRKWPKK